MAEEKLTEKLLKKAQAIATGREYIWDTELPGYGAVVSPTGISFVARHRVDGTQRKITFGRRGEPLSSSRCWESIARAFPTPKRGEKLPPWTAVRARSAATILLGQMKGGIDPTADKRAKRVTGPTLRDGLELHIANMRLEPRSPRSIDTIEKAIPKYLAGWMDRPIIELTARELRAVCDRIRNETKPREGSVNPPGKALAKRLIAHVSVCWNTLAAEHSFTLLNPGGAVKGGTLKERIKLDTKGLDRAYHPRISDGDFADWLAKVETLSPVRRDLQLLVLFTGLRSESARSIRWEDLNGKSIHVAKAKGGKPYKVPRTKTLGEILDRRREENALEFGPFGGDDGWVFPALSRDKPQRVIKLSEPKEWRLVAGKRIKFLPGLHALRRTFNSVAIEVEINVEHRLALMNHKPQGVNLKHYGSPENWPGLAESARTVEAALWERLRPTTAKRKPKRTPKRKRARRR